LLKFFTIPTEAYPEDVPTAEERLKSTHNCGSRLRA
jgi:hypothetical protein